MVDILNHAINEGEPEEEVVKSAFFLLDDCFRNLD